MPDITGDKSAPVKKQFNPRPQESAKAMISVVFVGYRSPFYFPVQDVKLLPKYPLA